MILFIVSILLILLGGCTSPSTSLKDIDQRVADQVALLIDSGYLPTKFVEIVEVGGNDSNAIYRITASNSPASTSCELPSKIIQYKDRNFCFVKLREPEISRTELLERGIVSDSIFWINNYGSDEGDWWLALRRYEDKHTLVWDQYRESLYIIEIDELLPYLAGGSPCGPVTMALLYHDIAVADSLDSRLETLDIDSMKHYTERFFGKMLLINRTDSTVVLSKNGCNGLSYAVVNGPDTLKLSLRDPLPIVIKPHGSVYPRYDSEPSHRFLQNLPEKDLWMSMYRLFSDSTYCFLNVNGVPANFRILHNDTRYRSSMKVDSNAQKTNFGGRYNLFYNKGIRDKRQREYDFLKIYSGMDSN